MVLEGQRVVIMSGISGIGLAVAHAFLDASATVVIARHAQATREPRLRNSCPSFLWIFVEPSRNRLFGQVGRFDRVVIIDGDGIMGSLQEVKATFESKC